MWDVANWWQICRIWSQADGRRDERTESNVIRVKITAEIGEAKGAT